jgi:hypothetical protein
MPIGDTLADRLERGEVRWHKTTVYVSKTGVQNSQGMRGSIAWFCKLMEVMCTSLKLRGSSIPTPILVGVI